MVEDDVNHTVRTPDELFSYQKKMVNFQCSKKESMIWADMGLGKTVVTLTSLSYLLNKGLINSALIVAPLRVVRMVWESEAQKWCHTNHLTFSSITGTVDQRSRALMRKANIYLINYENIGWLAQTLITYFIKKNKQIPFNGLVWDEISKMKNSTTNRVKLFRKIAGEFKWITGLTGTPVSNGYIDLHGQFLVLDKGARLGTSKTNFRNEFYFEAGYYKYIPRHDSEERIKHLIGDITLEMSCEDYNPLPDILYNDINIEMPSTLREKYNRMEKEFFLVLDSGSEVDVFNQASLTNKCLQFSNGNMYINAEEGNKPGWERVHDLKLDVLEDIIEEASGEQILCAYAYRSDAEIIMKKFSSIKPINLTACKTDSSLKNAMKRWGSGDCRLMIGHPASMGHGIDGLQQNGHILAWYGLTWSLDLYQQFNARIRRQGQQKKVVCHRIMCTDTLDQAQSIALDTKSSTQADLRSAIKKYRSAKIIV